MESIRELKEICRKKHTKGVSKPHWWATFFARRVSIYITWLIVRYTNISANQVTIWQLISSLIGIGLLCFANTWIAFVGVLLLHLGYVFDNVDGEVARYRKSQSINGMFLDFVNHNVIIPFTFSCYSFHLFFASGELLYFITGLIAVLCGINPVGAARQTVIYFLIKKRKSPTYDFTCYNQQEANKNFNSDPPKIDNSKKIKNIIKYIRSFISNILDYPNDIILLLLI